MPRKRFYTHPFFFLSILITIVLIINYKLLKYDEVSDTMIEEPKEIRKRDLVQNIARGPIRKDRISNNEDQAIKDADEQWLEDTKALLYDDTAKDGLPSEESLVKAFRLAKENLTRRCDLWKQQTDALLQRMKQVSTQDEPKFFLTAVLYIRIYEHDKAKLTTRELLQWIRFYLYAGVDHIYVYDSFVTEDESQKEELEKYVSAGFVSYFDWHEHNPYDLQRHHIPAYQHSLDHFKEDMLWQMAFDMDEYPYSPIDKDPGFLPRFVKRFKERNPDVTEMTLENYLVIGSPDPKKEWLLERVFRETKKPGNYLVKPIYVAKNVRSQLHHNSLLSGTSRNTPADEIRFKHYWCARLQEWGADTQEVLDLSTPEYGILDSSYVVRNCHVPALPHPY